jgi:hypothetical protein
MTRGHYEKIADAIVENVKYEGYNDYRMNYSRFMDTLVSIFEKDNSLFKKNIFRKRANVHHKHRGCKC